jgi:Lar family restriction alleviation protein
MKPCPFCGQESLEILDGMFTSEIVVECPNCKAEGPHASSEAEAIALWDARVDGGVA